MPRKRNASRASPVDRRGSEVDEDDFYFDDNQSNSGRGSHEPQQRNAANARERARMRVLSKAFCRLKTTLPWVPADTKLSKLDTLRLAASYIAHLRTLLQEEPCAASQMFPHPLNLAWPFAFQHGGSSATTASPRWSPPDSTQTSNNITPNIRDRENNNQNTLEYCQEYPENGFSDREYGLNNVDRSQYSQCQYKDNYYGLRNNYASGSLMNNV